MQRSDDEEDDDDEEEEKEEEDAVENLERVEKKKEKRERANKAQGRRAHLPRTRCCLSTGSSSSPTTPNEPRPTSAGWNPETTSPAS